MGASTTDAAEIEHAGPAQGRPGSKGADKDIVASFLAKHGQGQRIVVTPAVSARVLRRIDIVILPIMLTVYFLQVYTQLQTSDLKT